MSNRAVPSDEPDLRYASGPGRCVGPVLVGVGMALFTRVGPGGNYVTEVLPAVTVLGLGLATTVASLTATVLDAVPAQHAAWPRRSTTTLRVPQGSSPSPSCPPSPASPATPTSTRVRSPNTMNAFAQPMVDAAQHEAASP
jgi:hypothetical protein